MIKVKGDELGHGPVEASVYFGQMFHEQSAMDALLVRESPADDPVVAMLLDPRNTRTGNWPEYRDSKSGGFYHSCVQGFDPNEIQKHVIQGLANAVEVIRGPPGTGKTTTAVLMTASRANVSTKKEKLEGRQRLIVCVAQTNAAAQTNARKAREVLVEPDEKNNSARNVC